MDVPFCYGPQQAKDVDYMVRQFSDLIDLISRLTGQRFDIEKTRQALAFTDEANRQWKRFYDLARTRPSAITAFDTFVHMAPYVVYRGTRTLVDHFTMLADEAERQLADGIYPVPDEKYRLLWDNIAPWHQLRAMSTRLKDLSANIVYATYTSCIGSAEGQIDAIELIDPDPLRNVARMQNFTICSYGLDLRFQAMARLIERYRDRRGRLFVQPQLQGLLGHADGPDAAGQGCLRHPHGDGGRGPCRRAQVQRGDLLREAGGAAGGDRGAQPGALTRR